jgi:hypothetical protein
MPTLEKINRQNSPVRVFVSFAAEDEKFEEQFNIHLTPLLRGGFISAWSSGRLQPGADWSSELRHELEGADIIVILVSPDYLASAYLQEQEMTLALERHRLGLSRAIPIILRPAQWMDTPLASLQALPSSGRPISSYEDLDYAWSEVVSGLRLAIDEIRGLTPITSSVAPRQIFHLYEVFKPSGVPTITFVKQADFDHLALSLHQPGRGVIIEGPSGSGKTTALKQLAPEVKILSARKPEDIDAIRSLPREHSGSVAIDDFHRLSQDIATQVVDRLKYLADYEPEDKKLVVLGIPRTGQRLVDISFDLATRIDVFRLSRVGPEVVTQMIEKGEQALNVVFPRKAEIARAAAGSLNIGQLLCFNLCTAEGVVATKEETKRISGALDVAIERAMNQISLKFGDLIRYFASLGDRRDHTSIELLKELSRVDDGFLSLRELADARPELSARIRTFLDHDFMAGLYRRVPTAQNHLLFDPAVPALIIDDPQLTFYLRQTPMKRLMRITGKSEAVARSRVFVSYSHADSEWLKRLRVHLKPLEREGLIDVWDDTRLRGGSRWRQEIRAAIDTAKVAILLVSADFLASDFIADDELPPLLTASERDGLVVLPVIVEPSRFSASALAEFQAVNSPNEPLSSLTRPKREQIFVKIAAAVEETVGLVT